MMRKSGQSVYAATLGLGESLYKGRYDVVNLEENTSLEIDRYFGEGTLVV